MKRRLLSGMISKMANSLVKAKTAKVKPGGEGMKTRPSRFGTTNPPAIAPGRYGLAAPSSGRSSKHRLLVCTV